MSNSPTSEDSAEYFGLYVATKLREMDPKKRERCELQIIQVLCSDEA